MTAPHDPTPRAGGAAVPPPPDLLAHGAMLLFAALISVSFSLGQRAAPHIAPEALTLARFLLAAVVMGALARARLARAHGAAPWRYLVLGGLLVGYFVLMFEALRLTDPVSTSAIFTLVPAMAAVFAWIILRQTTSPRVAASLAIAGAGALWVIFRGNVAALVGFEIGPGEAIFFAGCALHALYAPLVRRFNRGEPVIVFTFATLLGGIAVLVVLAGPAALATDWTALPPVVWIAVVYLGLFATAGSFFLLQFAALRLRSAVVMAYGYLVPSFVILWEGLFAGDWVAAPIWLGVGATVLALAMLLRRD